MNWNLDIFSQVSILTDREHFCSPLPANAWNKECEKASRIMAKTKLWVKKKKQKNNKQRVVPLLSTHRLHTSSSSSSPLPLSRWLMKLPQHRLIPQSSHWSIRPLDSNYSCSAGAGERRAHPGGCRRRLCPGSLAPSKLTQINSDTQT